MSDTVTIPDSFSFSSTTAILLRLLDFINSKAIPSDMSPVIGAILSKSNQRHLTVMFLKILVLLHQNNRE